MLRMILYIEIYSKNGLLCVRCSKELQRIMETIWDQPAILSFIERFSSLQRYKCASVIEKGPQSASFVERLCVL